MGPRPPPGQPGRGGGRGQGRGAGRAPHPGRAGRATPPVSHTPMLFFPCKLMNSTWQ